MFEEQGSSSRLGQARRPFPGNARPVSDPAPRRTPDEIHARNEPDRLIALAAPASALAQTPAAALTRFRAVVLETAGYPRWRATKKRW